MDVALLCHALPIYYTATVLEAAKLVAPRAKVLAGTGAEQHAALWPEDAPARAALRRHCQIFANIALPDDEPRDLFRALYEALFPRELRHANGEYYTPGWVADLTLDRAGFSGREGGRVLDPSCGSGVFLVHALHRLKNRGPESLDNIFGFDNNPLAVLTARVNMLAALGQQARRTRRVPNVFLRDCILDDTAPLPQRTFDFVVGNPPWVLWDNLSESYREQTAELWKRYGLFNLPGTQARLGGGKKDLAMLFTYAAADKHLAPGGRMAFVINQAILQSVRAGAGFRRFKIGDTGDDLQVTHFDDLTSLQLFDASARPGIIVMQKGRPTSYPIPYIVWSRAANASELLQTHKFARPVEPARRDSPWEIVDTAAAAHTTVTQAYTARTGAYTGGANAVFWIEVLSVDGRTARIRNISDAGKRALPQKERTIESDLIYPLLRWRDVARWRAAPRQHILLVQDPASRKPVPEMLLQSDLPRTHAYLKEFEETLLGRKSKMIRDLMRRAAFYAMFGIGPYTLSPWKVVWKRMVKQFTAAVVGSAGIGSAAVGSASAGGARGEGAADGSAAGRSAAASGAAGGSSDVGGGVRPIIPQETLTFIPCATESEAHYLCAILNSPQTTERARRFAVPGGKSFGTAGMLQHIPIQGFAPDSPAHMELAKLSRAAHQAARTEGDASDIEHRIAEVVGEQGMLG